MAIAWFICPYKRLATGIGLRIPSRYCAMQDFTEAIRADGGAWSESEILGNRAIVKVRASAATLALITGTPTFRRIPPALLDDPLSTLTAGQQTAIRNEILDAGYSLAEIDAVLPDFAAVTLRQALRFLATRRRKPRYDALADTIVLDGPVQGCRSIDELDGAVS